VAEFRNADFEWLIHRQVYTKRIDVVQLEYTPLAQYAAQFRNIPSIVFEHDVYFQSIARGLRYVHKAVPRWHALFEYLRALRYEAVQLRRADRIQVCSRENREYLESFFPSLRGRIDDGFRAGIDTSLYNFRTNGREPRTMLFLGSFRHTPNQEALEWFARLVLPRIVERMPEARLKVVGAEPPALHSLPENAAAHMDLVGFVENAREPLGRYAVFVCPILSGSGVRVKLLEAFASGIPVVSTRLGAEGLAVLDGEICALADDPVDFAKRVLELLEDASQAQSLAQRARDFVVREKDIGAMTCRLVESYRETVGRMRSANPAPPAASDQFQPEREQPA
jgi:glycosyltransferase involved in cell wall biosynthesis